MTFSGCRKAGRQPSEMEVAGKKITAISADSSYGETGKTSSSGSSVTWCIATCGQTSLLMVFLQQLARRSLLERINRRKDVASSGETSSLSLHPCQPGGEISKTSCKGSTAQSCCHKLSFSSPQNWRKKGKEEEEGEGKEKRVSKTQQDILMLKCDSSPFLQSQSKYDEVCTINWLVLSQFKVNLPCYTHGKQHRPTWITVTYFHVSETLRNTHKHLCFSFK